MIITRTILPIENRQNFGFPSETGLGDLNLSLFLTPPSTKSGFSWGVGPVFLMPTATEPHLGSKKWGAGPSAVFVQQTEHWTLGLLASQIWSFAGESERSDVNVTGLQPFIVYHLPEAWSLMFTSEYTYDWTAGHQTVPLNFLVGKLFRIGELPVSVSVGGRYYADKPEGGPDWGVRILVVFVLPDFF